MGESDSRLLEKTRGYVRREILRLRSYPNNNVYAKNLLWSFENVLRVAEGNEPKPAWGDGKK